MNQSEKVAILAPILRNAEAVKALRELLRVLIEEKLTLVDSLARKALLNEAVRVDGLRALGKLTMLTDMSKELDAILGIKQGGA